MKSEELGIEIWKDIPSFEGAYQISDLGNIRSFKYKKERILKPSICRTGYLRLSLHINKKCIYRDIHRLVMLTFHGESDLQVDHINGIKTDNRLINLRYATPRENITNFVNLQYSKYVGVNAVKELNKWKASIFINKINYHLGTFSSPLIAHNVYQNALFNWNTFKILPLKIVKQYDISKKLIYTIYEVENNLLSQVLNVFSSLEDAKIAQKELKQKSIILPSY